MPRFATACISALALMSAAGLGACDKLPGNQSAALSSPAADDKLAAYTTVFNTLIGGMARSDRGLVGRADAYLGWDASTASPDDVIELDAKPEWLVTALADFKKARAMRGDQSLTAVDQAADPLIAAMDTIVRVEGGLEGYYETRAYKQDGLARGKAADPELRKAYQDAMAAMKRMEAALNVVQRQANDARAEQQSSRGYIAEASLLKAMSRGERMTTAVLADDVPAASKAADELQTALEEMRVNKPRLKNKDSSESYDLVAKSLTDALAAYRDSLTGNADVGRYAVVAHYNNAVQFSTQVKVPE